MKKIMLSAVIAVMAISWSVTDVSAQGRRGGREGGGRVENNHSRGNQRHNSGGNRNSNNMASPGMRPGNGGSVRPGNNGNKPGGMEGLRPGNNNNKPGNAIQPGHGNGSRPNVGNGMRPGNNRPGTHGVTHPGGSRPAPAPALRPGASRPPVLSRPHRPGMAPVLPFSRPVPPPNWRPAYRRHLWSDILGITVGMAVNTAIDRLLYGGYTIDGYGTNEVYLRNVPQFDFYWPDATMYYGPNGFIGSRFYYSTIGYDMARYRSVYNMLTAQFGAPVSVRGQAATWYGTGNQYITLDFTSSFTDAGQRYFTTLSIGM
ncbi:MAG: hypothetical protein NC043_09190 [Muribaculaceae bacterium]|nr:hypothetical protein [Muribaculaceae bacterium]